MSHDRDKPRVAVHDNAIDITFTVGLHTHTVSVDPEDAWDLGDDLIVASDPFMDRQPVGFTTFPPWGEHIKAAVVNGRLMVICDDHGTIHYPGMLIELKALTELARAHWKQQHSADVDVAEHAEGEDADADADPAVPEAEPQAEPPVADAHGSGD